MQETQAADRPKVREPINGHFTEYTVLQVLSEHKNASKVPRGMKRVMAVIRAGRHVETRHINVPK